MSTLSILTVAIATTQARLNRITTAHLPIVPGLKWHIFVQAETTPLRLDRDRPDIALTITSGTGAARNRNAALKVADTPFLLFADDDLHFSAKALAALVNRFASEPQMDFLCARLSDENGHLRKRYCADGTRARWWNCGKVGTPELALRLERFRSKGIAFDPNFGAGMSDYLGDEYIFLCDALRAGLRGRHVGLLVASHPAESSGTRKEPATMEIRRRVLIRALGRWKSLPARLAFALRHRSTFGDGRAFWRFLR